MKHSVQNICIFILALLLAGCGGSEVRPDYVGEVSPYAEKEVSEILQVYMEDSVVAVDAEKIIFYVVNTGDVERDYGGHWNLEVLYEGVWHTVPVKTDQTVYYTSIARISRPYAINEHTFFLNELYDYQYDSGTYRLVQKYIEDEKDKIMALEFQMAE